MAGGGAGVIAAPRDHGFDAGGGVGLSDMAGGAASTPVHLAYASRRPRHGMARPRHLRVCVRPLPRTVRGSRLPRLHPARLAPLVSAAQRRVAVELLLRAV